MKNLFTILLAISLVAVGSALASKVTGINLNQADGFTVAQIDVEGDVRFTHQTEIAKDGKPFRIIVNVLAATHEMGVKVFENLPECRITGIRSSQYAVDPEKIVRIVFDMKGETAYRIDAEFNSLKVYVSDPDAVQFPAWSSHDVLNDQSAETTLASDDQTAMPESTQAAPAENGAASIIASINKALDEDRLLSLEPSPARTEVKPGSSTVSDSPDTNSKPVVTEFNIAESSHVQEELNPETAPESVSQQMSDTNAPKTATQILEEINRETAAALEGAQPEDMLLESTPVETTLTGLTKDSITPNDGTQEVVPDSNPQPDQPVKSNDGTNDSKEPVKKSLLPPSPNKTESGKLAEAGVETGTISVSGADDQSTARFRRDPTQSKRIRGTLVAEFPTRLVIKYKGKDFRDPFETLINETKVQNNPMEQRVPNVEGLHLVGILEASQSGNSALFEDKDGYGYILKGGDKVQKGYVLRVDEDRVYFQIFEYGWSRTVALDMEIF